MANRNSFTSTSAAQVLITDTGLENLVLKTGYADGAVIYALFGSANGEVVLKHVFEDGSESTYQTVACTAGTLNVISITHKLPHMKVYYTHAGAGAVNIETVTSLGQI